MALTIAPLAFGTVLAATIGSLAGALLLYAIARFGGRKLVLRFGKVLRVKEKDLDKATQTYTTPHSSDFNDSYNREF